MAAVLIAGGLLKGLTVEEAATFYSALAGGALSTMNIIKLIKEEQKKDPKKFAEVAAQHVALHTKVNPYLEMDELEKESGA